MDIWIVSLIILATLYLLISEKIPMDVTGLGVMAVLTLFHGLSPVYVMGGGAFPHQFHHPVAQQQRHRRTAPSRCHFHSPGPRYPPQALHHGGLSRGKRLLCNLHRLQDQPAGLRPRRLPFPRLSQARDPSEPSCPRYGNVAHPHHLVILRIG